VLAKRIPPTALAGVTPEELAGAVLLAPVQLNRRTVRKGTSVDVNLGAELIAAARSGGLGQSLRIGWPDATDLHEDEAAERLAVAAGGHGQAVQAGQVVASVKVAPHLIPAALVDAGVRIACEHAPLVDVRPYLALEVAALVAETMADTALARFEAGARTKVEALGGRFAGTTVISSGEPDAVEREARAALESLAIARKVPVILVGGVSAGDPLAPFYAALRSLGGGVVRHGVPAHPGSMIWLAELGDSRLLGLPQCGMFTMATAADLILPRLLTGERLTRESLAELAHGGVLTREMRFRFPAYAQDLEAPEG
jgi:hypothetical protein